MKDLPAGENLMSAHNTGKHEALSALVMLGFNRPVAEKALDQVIKANGGTLPVDQLIKSALKILWSKISVAQLVIGIFKIKLIS